MVIIIYVESVVSLVGFEDAAPLVHPVGAAAAGGEVEGFQFVLVASGDVNDEVPFARVR